MRVARGTRLMTLAPLASSERDQSIEARRAVEAAQAEAEAARLRLQRLEQLLKDGAASVRSVEEARAQLQINEAALNAARDRLAAVRQGPVGPRRARLPSPRLSTASFSRYPRLRDKPSRRPRRCCRSRRSTPCGFVCRCLPAMSMISTPRSRLP